MSATERKGLHILLISVHGLIRGENLELGRDSDTGGQTLYVVELARALGRLPEVARVDLMTRRVVDPSVSGDYAEPVEDLAPGVRLVRIDAGPEEYIRKEGLWDYLDSFSDNAADWLRGQGRLPDVIHSHYADAGYVGTRLAHLFGLPLVHTGHSLGRVKRMRLLASGVSHEEVEHRFNMSRRVEAEEETLATAELVIASTHNEIEEQYGLYDCYHPGHMAVVPPGTDLERFHAPDGSEAASPTARAVARFLDQPEKPIILAIARPDERKNLGALVIAYGERPDLREMANLVLVLGSREDIRDMGEDQQNVFKELLVLIDRYDLYGKVAYPKAIDSVPDMYRLAGASGGVFVNAALTEPFGLTIIEAAASGVPVVATEDGGPTDIIGNCRNGLLVDPLSTEAIGQAIADVLGDRKTWKQMRDDGLTGVARHYSWAAHAESYLTRLRALAGKAAAPRPKLRRRSIYRDAALFTDIDQSLLGDPDALARLGAVLRENRKCVAFGIATGRTLDSALRVIRRHGIPMPDILITSTGTEIDYAPKLIPDDWWTRHIDHHWNPREVYRVLGGLNGLTPQPKELQSRFKISYYIDPDNAPCLDEIQSLLYQAEVGVNVILSFGQFLDVLPIRASKGMALRYAANQLEIPLERILVAGGSGADEDMMRGNTLGVVVANRHHEELSGLEDVERIFFADQPHAAGILEAIDHYDLFGECSVPRD